MELLLLLSSILLVPPITPILRPPISQVLHILLRLYHPSSISPQLRFAAWRPPMYAKPSTVAVAERDKKLLRKTRHLRRS
ncbi:hypothetical protein F4810DRAFT_682285 [Camillea tinctor]|nr:hypothetical protein F4810DRAFT_682285 [Camillea tinctor]